MKHIKRWGRVNENEGGEECDFETFKEIMIEVSDIFTCEFSDESDEFYYKCSIELPQYGMMHDAEMPKFNFDYLTDLIGWDEDPTDFMGVDDNVRDSIRENREMIDKIKSHADDVVRSHTKLLKLFDILEEDILPRFKSFSNFVYMSIGYGYDGLVVSFEMEDEGYE